MASEDQQSQTNIAEGRSLALPEKLPTPTYAPPFLALGIIFLLFGLVSTFVFSAAGAVLIIWSISKWVGELLDGQ